MKHPRPKKVFPPLPAVPPPSRKVCWCQKCNNEENDFCRSEHVWALLGSPEGAVIRLRMFLREEQEHLTPEEWEKTLAKMREVLA